ncbi:hypothetical protein LJB88_00030 [Erysipelotrichaceae bacterium OttesenSCG-928-M19]|nr:hypothetical protein [Erysipelotrichaceae bacterium OttesenSCG-928-M19]
MNRKYFFSFFLLAVLLFTKDSQAVTNCHQVCPISSFEKTTLNKKNIVEKYNPYIEFKNGNKNSLITNGKLFYKGKEVGFSKTNKKKEIIEIDTIDYIYQKQKKYQRYDCPDDGAFLTDDFAIHGCMVFNFTMVNNAINNKQTSIKELYNNGYRCHFDYEKAKDEFGYSEYQKIDISNEFTNDINYEFENKDDIVKNGKKTFVLKDILQYNKTPIMVWLVPNNDTTLDEGHLVTIYKYEKQNQEEHFYFYDTFNQKTPSRDFNEFITRWKIAQLYLLY